jgi:hypothetical protein
MARKIDHLADVEKSASGDYWIDRSSLELQEVFSPEFLRRTRALNELVIASGEKIEGGLFYWNGTENFLEAPPAQSLAPSRRNLWRAARFKKYMLEIGMNAGHSALLALSLNPQLIYHGVDISWHKYTKPCAEFLRREFAGRFHFFAGDSREVLPYLAEQDELQRFDLYHVDGGHSREICFADVSNCIRIAHSPNQKGVSHLLLDDINASWIYDVYCEFVSKGNLITENFFGDWEDVNRNVLARICRPNA